MSEPTREGVAASRHFCMATDDPEIAYAELRRLRRENRRERYDMVEVRHTDPPIRTARKWAVVHYV